MSTEVVASDSKALTVQQRAMLALGLADVETTLTSLAESSKSITAITNTAGYDQCHAARMQLVRERLHITKRGKEAREDAQKFSKAVIAEESRLVGLIKPEEDRLQKLQDEHDAAVAAEKQRRIDAELARVESLQECVAELRGNRTLSAMIGSGLIAEHISDLERITVDDSFQEFRQAAEDAKASGLLWLREVHAAAVAHEAEQARLKAEREELVRLRAEQACRDAEDRAKREEEERQAKKAREAEDARLAEQRRLQREQQEREDAERRRILAEQEAAAKVAREAEAARLQKEREAHEAQMRREREEQEATARAERDRIAVENRQAAATRKAEEDRIAAERAKFAQEQEAARKAAEPPAPTRMRPKADDLVKAVAVHFHVSAAVALKWIQATDFSKAQDAA